MVLATAPVSKTSEVIGAPLWGDAVQRRLILPLVRACFPMTITGQRDLLAVPVPCIFAADHASHLDTLAILAALPDAIRCRVRVAAAEDYWYRDPLHRIAVSAIGGFPFPRKGTVGLNRAAALLASGHCVLIYPEGTRSGGSFRPGVARLAAGSGVPVVPIAVHGGRTLWPKGQAIPHRGPLAVSFGTPLQIAPDVSAVRATRQIEKAIRTLSTASAPPTALAA